MKKQAKWFLGLAATVLLAACGNTAQEASKKGDVTKSNFSETVTHEGTPINGGILKYGLIASSPFAGILNINYYEDAYDAQILDFIDESLFVFDENKRITDKGIGKFEYNQDEKTVTVTIREGVKWSDGQPLTIDDYIYAFEVLGHKDYTGTRYAYVKAIEGVEEYRAGKASTISGITKNSDYSVTLKFKEFSSDVVKAGGFWSNPMPKHVYKDIPISEQASSDATRKNPVGLGAFRVKSIVSGESVTMEANEYYWKGKPKLEGVIVELVNDTNSADEFKNGNYDLMSVPTATAIYDKFKTLDNTTILGSWSNAISYIGFKLGTWDKAQNSVVANPDGKMANKSLRQAMGYALDLDQFSSSFYSDLRVRANSLMVPTFKDLRDGTLEGFPYDKEKAMKLLDEAGYKDKDGDGLREDPKGNKLTINLGFMSGGEAEAQAQYYLQQWKAVGLDVKLTNGRLIEFNTFYDLVENDDPSIDVYVAAWTVGGNPNPNRLWGNTGSNYTRYTSEAYEKILSKFNTADMFDEQKQIAAYKEWQAFAQDEAFAIPTQYRLTLTAVNKRVKNLDVSPGVSNYSYNLNEIELTAIDPIKSTK